ncbi:Polyprotein [Phytophthora palmivora]|uniref:Polyprotein n=1 Tax=Phytophthora palmivora TaxID=4796 RepID=A0A2P4XN96_9STRA|nr:Polyprotein [Phytophthora palmivora]
MSRKDVILGRMSGAIWFSCFDLLSGYYQILMRMKDIPFTTFQTPNSLLNILLFPMGLRIFADVRGFVAIYFDDLYIFTKEPDLRTHLTAVRKVFERRREKKLYLKLAKSTLCSDEIPCLGDFVGRRVRIYRDKVHVIRT